MNWDDMSKNKMPWPSVKAVHKYRRQVYETVTRVISQLTDEQCATLNMDSPVWALPLSFEHERIHIETSSVLINELPQKYLRFPEGLLPPYYPCRDTPATPTPGKDYPVNNFLPVPSQTVSLGKPRDTPSFGWDNEYGERRYEVPAFNASRFKVTNGEFFEFVRDGGYSKPEYWTKTGWGWR